MSQLRSRRCLIPADGFYEWKREGKEKLPFCFTLADESVFAFAGVWDRWKSPQGQVVETCSILTTTPNLLMQDIHDRMPVILERDAYELWLDPGFTKVEELQPLLKPYPAEAMRRYRVSQRVNQVKNDDPECSAAIDADKTLFPGDDFSRNDRASVKIVRAHLGGTDFKWTDVVRLHRDYVLLILQLSFNQQKLFIDHHALELLINSGCDDSVGNARLIFEAEKYESLCRAGRWRAMTHPAIQA